MLTSCCRRFLHVASKISIKRPPVVTIMGHVDHGKTTLLDHLRNSKIVQQEFGGITQHIGAFVVPFKLRNSTELVTFLDTPGHAAFASMRQRGADVTDIVVLVVACEDGVLDQTLESIKYAKNSQVPIIVAVNKIDKFPIKSELDKQIANVRQQLFVHDVITEHDGGEVQMITISALKGVGIEDLKESIIALAETLDLKACTDVPCRGHVIEAGVDKARGKVCTILVKDGVLRKGDIIMAGDHNWARARALFDERNKLQQTCGPGLPIQVTGWREEDMPSAGDPVYQVESEAKARQIVHEYRGMKNRAKWEQDALEAQKRHEVYYENYKVLAASKARKYYRIFELGRGVRAKETKEDPFANQRVHVVLKCDVDGSLDAILELLDTYDPHSKQTVKLDVIHYGVGPISNNDLALAQSFQNTVIYGFNVKAIDQQIMLDAKRSGVPLKLYNVIYHLIDDLKQRLSDKIPELLVDKELGRARVVQEFVVSERKKKLHVAGCMCESGSLKSNGLYKVIRNTEVVADEMSVKTLKHLKDDVKEIARGKDCGVSFAGEHEKFVFVPGDLLVCYEKVTHKPKLKWDLRGFD